MGNFNDILADGIARFKEQEKRKMTFEWIKPSDLMPEPNERVLVARVYDPNLPLQVEQGSYEGFNDWWKVFGTRIKTKNVKYWAPMPTAPEE